MQKKILISIMAILMLLLVGCKDKMGAEAKVTYASYTLTGDDISDKMIEVTVTLENSVYVNHIKSVTADVTCGTTTSAINLSFYDNEIDDKNKKIVVYAFKDSEGNLNKDSDGNTITPQTENSIKIKKIICEDENGNDVEVEGIIPKITINSGTTTGGSTTTELTAVTTVKAEVSGTKIKVTWDSNANATLGYRVYRSEMTGANPVFLGSDTLIPGQLVNGEMVTTSLNSYEDTTSLVVGNTYSYRVVAISTAKKETPKQDKPSFVTYSYTNTTTTTVKITIPAPTTITTAEDTAGISISWSKVTVSGKNILGYNIYASDDYNNLDVTKDLTGYLVGSTPTVELGLLKLITVNDKYGTTNFTTGKNYYFRIAAVAEDKSVGEKSELVRGYIYNEAAPTPKQSEVIWSLGTYNDPITGKSISGVKIDWTRFSEAGKDIKEYKLYKASSSNGPFSYKATIPVGTKTYVDSVEPGSTSYYVISCVTNSGGEGKKSGAITVKDDGAPGIIADNLISVTAVNDRDKEKALTPDRRFILSWGGYGAPSDIAGYKIYISKATLKDVDGNRISDDSMTFAFMEGANNGYKLIADVGYNVNVPIDPNTVYTGATDYYDNDGENTKTAHYFIKITAYDVLGNESQQSLYKLTYNITPKTLKADISLPSVKVDTSGGRKITPVGDAGTTYAIYRNNIYVGSALGYGSYIDADGATGNTYSVKIKYSSGTTGEMSNTTVAP